MEIDWITLSERSAIPVGELKARYGHHPVSPLTIATIVIDLNVTIADVLIRR